MSVVVHDNASTDGTAELIAERQAAGAPIAYHRFDHDQGAAANIFAAVGRAEADWCWLLSSDDRLVPGALARVLQLLDAHPGVAGIMVGQVVFDRELGTVAPAQAPAAPAIDTLTELRSVDAIVEQLGWMLTGLSSHVVRRDLWRDAHAAIERGDAGRPTPIFYPQVAAALGMARANPRWLWCPEKLVQIRAGNVSYPAGRRFEALLLTELDAHWRAAVGRGPARRQVLAHVRRAWAERDGLRHLKCSDEDGLTDDLRLLVAFARVFRSSPRAWVQLGPVLLMPSRLLRRRMRPWRGTTAALAPDDAVVVRAPLPGRMRRADELAVRVHVRNTAGTTIASGGDHPLHLVAHWRRMSDAGRGDVEVASTDRDPDRSDGDDRDGAATLTNGRQALRRPIRPGRSATAPYLLVAPWEAGTWMLTLTTSQEPGRGTGPPADAVQARVVVTEA